MEERNITITLEQARELFNTGNTTSKDIALQAFREDELMERYKSIRTFKDACEILHLNWNNISVIVRSIAQISKSSAAIFKLRIIRKALNLNFEYITKGQKNFHIYYPRNPFVKENCYNEALNSTGKMEVIGVFKNEEILYRVLGNCADYGGFASTSNFYSGEHMGNANGVVGLLGCVSIEIAEHFSKYFGMLITEAKFADMLDFEVVEDKYDNTKQL